MGLRKRIILLVALGLLVATVPLALMGIDMLRAATDRVLAERLAMTRASADHLNQRLADAWDGLDRLGRTVPPLWTSKDLDGIRSVFTVVGPQMPLFSGGIFLMDLAGRPVLQEPTRSLFWVDLSHEASLRAALQSSRPGISHLLRTRSGTPVVILTMPVAGPTGAPAGAVGGIINLAGPGLLTFFEGLAVGVSGHAAIVNEEGIVLASTEPAEQFTRGEHPAFIARHLSGGRALVGPAEESHGPGDRGEIHIMAFAPLTVAPWGVMVGQNEAETFGPIRRLRDRTVIFGALLFAVALLFAWLDTGAVVGPLQLLQHGAERIAGGDLAQPIQVRRSDEIGALATSFETMRVRLLDSTQEIQRRAVASQSLYEVGTEVLSLRDRDVVLRSVAARASSLLHADAAVVCLVDETGKTARVTAVAGPRAGDLSISPSFSVPVGDAGPICLDCSALEAPLRGLRLAAPLAIGGRTMGALCVTGGRSPFSAGDNEILGGLANLAAIAVENARLQDRVQSAAVLEERERIARELHDSLGQVLGYVNTKAQAVRALLDDGKVAEGQAQLEQMVEAARDVYADLREAILGLRMETSPERRLMPVLEAYVRRFGELSGIEAALVVNGDPAAYALSPTTELHLIRIIQEALTNVRKHAMARRASVAFVQQDGTLSVSVSDDGMGFDPARPQMGRWPRFGLQTMRERAEAIGGTLSVRSGAGGTEVAVTLPLARRTGVDARPAG